MKNNRAKPTPSRRVLRELFDYDPATGILTSRQTATPVGSPTGSHEKVGVSVRGVRFLMHRIIWKWMTGREPDVVDHINGDGRDNRWANLRSTSSAKNSQNQKLYRNNTSGHVGVQRRARGWRAVIQSRTIGTFGSKQEAIAARQAAEKKQKFHPNHGRR